MLPFSEACERNKEPILVVLRECLKDRLQVLEIGSGTGQHAVYFSRHMPHLLWHPTERLMHLSGLAARIQAEGRQNLRPAAVLDVRQTVWPLRSADAIFTANTLHIMSWAEVMAMYAGIGKILAPGGVLCVYGPFRYGGRYTSASNREFDRSLQERDPLSGLRDLDAVTALGQEYGLRLAADHDLPAFNRLIVFTKEA